jgi:HEPN domain-containing protein
VKGAAIVLDEREFHRWLQQAEQTLRAAEWDEQGQFWNWACSKAEQAAQYAVKGLLRALGVSAFGHSLHRLMEQVEALGISVPPEIWQSAYALEREYIPSRYADAYPDGSPYEFYDAQRTAACLEAARHILQFVREVANRARGLAAP